MGAAGFYLYIFYFYNVDFFFPVSYCDDGKCDFDTENPSSVPSVLNLTANAMFAFKARDAAKHGDYNLWIKFYSVFAAIVSSNLIDEWV